MKKKWRGLRFGILAFLGTLLLSIVFASPSHAHWADLAVAEIVVGDTQTKVTLTFPTGLVLSADDNRDGELTPNEISIHQAELQAFLSDRIRLTDNKGQLGVLTVKPSDKTAVPPNMQVTAGTHSTLMLLYSWLKPVAGIKINYNLFLPGVSTARCLATIFDRGQVQNVIFSPDNQQISLGQNSFWLPASSFLIAIAGSFVWGAMHAVSPGHGKTIVGAYLVGSRATPQHAVFLGLTTTITHTLGVFALGLVALFASKWIVPEQIYPWLSFISGLLVVIIGLNLLSNRLPKINLLSKWSSGHSHDHYGHDHHHVPHHQHDHDHSHDHHHDHDHDHSHAPHGGHSHHDHSHLPPGANGEPVTWRSLLALGISGGLVPCPSALVVLLSSVALGRTGFGLLLVLAFSLGLAATLTGIGLLLVGGKRIFDRFPTQGKLFRGLPAVSALLITLFGLGITTQALAQIGLVRL